MDGEEEFKIGPALKRIISLIALKSKLSDEHLEVNIDSICAAGVNRTHGRRKGSTSIYCHEN